MSAIVTGGTSGLGLATARLLQARGAAVLVVGLDADRGAAVERDLSAAGPAAFVRADVREPAACSLAVREAEARFGGVDVLVASAGVGVVGPLTETGPEDWRWTWETNVSGSLLAAQAALRSVRASGRAGAIVLVGSDAALVGERSIGAYSVTKAAVVMMTKVLAMDGAAHGIRVNCVCPGYFEPGMRHFPDRTAPDGGPGYVDPPRPPLGRYGGVQEMAAAVLYLAGPASSFCTGSVLLVDGGATAGIP